MKILAVLAALAIVVAAIVFGVGRAGAQFTDPMLLGSSGAQVQTLQPGTYQIVSGSNAVDASFSTGTPPYVQFAPTNLTSAYQQWVWDGTTFKNVAVNDSLGNAPGPYLADNGDTTVTVNAAKDAWLPVRTTTGWTLQNSRSGFYMIDAVISSVDTLAMSGGQAVAGVYAATGVKTGTDGPLVMLNTTDGVNFYPVPVNYTGMPTISINGSTTSTVAAGSSMTVCVNGGPGTPLDWVGLYNDSTPDVQTPTLGWDYLNGTQVAPTTGVTLPACFTMTAPSDAPGVHQARYYPNGLYQPNSQYPTVPLAVVSFTVQTQSIAAITQYTNATTFAANTANASLSPTIAVTMNPATPAFTGTLAINAVNPTSAVIWGYLNSNSTITASGTAFTTRLGATFSPGTWTEDVFQSGPGSIAVSWLTDATGTLGNLLAAAALDAPSLNHITSIGEGFTSPGATVTTTVPISGVITGDTFIGVVNFCCNQGITVTSIVDNASPTPNHYQLLRTAEFSSGIFDYKTLFGLSGIQGSPTLFTFTFSAAPGYSMNYGGDVYRGVTAIESTALIQWSSSNAASQAITLARASGNACGFHLTSATLPATVQAKAASGCLVGTYPDWTLTATQSGTVNGFLSSSESATAQ